MRAHAPGPTVIPVSREHNGPIDAENCAADRLVRALSAAETYGIDTPVLVRETHASWVFLAGRSAYKVKKPVRLAFLDYGTRERRHAACREELAVNRELAGSIYREVLAILPNGQCVRFAPDGTAGALDYAIRMRRFQESQTLESRAGDGPLERGVLAAVAQRLAAFHQTARVCDAGGVGDTPAAWEQNLTMRSPCAQASSSPLRSSPRRYAGFCGCRALARSLGFDAWTTRPPPSHRSSAS